MSEKITFDVSGLSCSACANTVQRILTAQPGVISAEVSFATNTATVEFQQTNAQALQTAVSALGYGLSVPDKKKA